MESKEKEAWFWMYCKHCKFKDTKDFEEPCTECLGCPSNEDSHKPVNYLWDGIGEEPKYDSTDERKIWHDNGEVVADEPRDNDIQE